MQDFINAADVNAQLERLVAELDQAIAQAIENPLLFVDNPLLRSIEISCRKLPVPEFVPQGADLNESTETLIWKVRGRAGRLKRLLDSAAQFYSSCFSPRPAADSPEKMAYGVQGEWGAAPSSSYLLVDC